MTDEVGQKVKEESLVADECSMNFADKQTRTSNVSGQESTRKSPTTKVTDGIFYLSASDGGLNALSSDGWHELEVTVDSGACDTVIPGGVIDHVQLHDSPGSLRNQAYEAANGSSIYNVGERRCVVGTTWESPPKDHAFSGGRCQEAPVVHNPGGGHGLRVRSRPQRGLPPRHPERRAHTHSAEG